MNDFAGVKIFQRLSKLVDDKPYVHIFQDVLSNHVVQISFHELEKQVDVSTVLCFYSFMQLYYVGVL